MLPADEKALLIMVDTGREFKVYKNPAVFSDHIAIFGRQLFMKDLQAQMKKPCWRSSPQPTGRDSICRMTDSYKFTNWMDCAYNKDMGLGFFYDWGGISQSTGTDEIPCGRFLSGKKALDDLWRLHRKQLATKAMFRKFDMGKLLFILYFFYVNKAMEKRLEEERPKYIDNK